MIYLVIASFVFQPAWVFIIAGNDINCSLVTCSVFILTYAMKHRKFIFSKLCKSMMIYSGYTLLISIVAPLLFSGLVITSMSNDGYNFNYFDTNVLGLSFSNITQPLSILLYSFTAVLLYSYCRNAEWAWFDKFFIRVFVFVWSVGMLHFVLVNVGLPITILRELFHNEYVIWGASIFDGMGGGDSFCHFMSTFAEPSYCGGYLSMCLMYFLFGDHKRKKELIGMDLIALILNMSSTGFATACIGIFIYILIAIQNNKINNKFLVGIISFAIVGIICIVLIPGIGDAIYIKTIGKVSTGSAKLRNINNMFCWDVFIKTYGIGAGLNTVVSYSLVFSLLSQIGAIGTLLYIFFVLNVYGALGRINNKTIRNQVFYLLTCSIIASVLSCSALNLCFFWQAICMMAIAVSSNDKRDSKHLKRII